MATTLLRAYSKTQNIHISQLFYTSSLSQKYHASALLAYAYALTPLFAPSLRAGMPEEERKVVERTVPRSDALARRATTLHHSH